MNLIIIRLKLLIHGLSLLTFFITLKCDIFMFLIYKTTERLIKISHNFLAYVLAIDVPKEK